MTEVIRLDIGSIYESWRTYLLENSGAKYFGMANDQYVADFPCAVLTLIGRPTNFTDLLNNEHTIDLTFQTDCYINAPEYTTLYAMDDACWEFFNNLGFRRMGDNALTSVDKNLYRITSRFTLQNFTGRFLNEIS